MSKSARLLFLAVYVLVGLGMVMTYSSSGVYAAHVYKNPYHFLTRQIIYAIFGTVMLFIVASVPVRIWKENSRAIMLLAICSMVVVFLPGLGKHAGGAQRWIRLGPIQFQPAEFAKLAVAIYLCDYLSRKKKNLSKGGLLVFLPPMVLVGILCVLSLLQPDLGSCVFILSIVGVLIFFSGLQNRYIFGAFLVLIPAFYFLVLRVPYRASRVTAYLNPWNDPQGNGFQIIQSLLAFANGGINGIGLGQGMQKLFYLPSSYNDFIFSIIGEELGLIGMLGVIFLYGVILVSGMQIMNKLKGDFERLLALALVVAIVLQALINMMVTTGLIPTKGLPLPFVSFGGTALVFNLIEVGLLMALDRSLQGGEKR